MSPRAEPKPRPALPKLQGNFITLMETVQWLDEDRVELARFTRTSFARAMTEAGFPMTFQYVTKLMRGQVKDPSALFIMTAARVFSRGAAPVLVSPMFFLDQRDASQTTRRLLERNEILERDLVRLRLGRQAPA